MTKHKRMIIYILVFFTNLLIILALCYFFNFCTKRILWNDQARLFLGEYKKIPIPPGKMMVLVITGYILLLISYWLKRKFINRQSFVHIFICLDLIIIYQITSIFDFCYTGLFLLVILNAMLFTEKLVVKLIYTLLACLAFILLDRGTLPINIYINAADKDLNIFVNIIRNIALAVNQMIFLLSVVIILQSEIKENEMTKLKNLNLQSSITLFSDYAERSEEIAKLKERNRLAREIHDSVGHYLTSIALSLDSCTEMINNNDLPYVRQQIGKTSDLSREALLDIRKSISDLKPDRFERLSLVEVIENIVDNIRSVAGIRFHVVVGDMVSNIPDIRKAQIYRIIQESLTNIVKHSNAKNAWIQLWQTNDLFYIEVLDDGIGCSTIHEGVGLNSIKERVAMLNGNVEFYSEPGKGFRTKICFNWRNESEK